MEIIETLAAGFVVIAVVAATMQVLFSYSLQVISEKNELPDFAAFLSWIPLLNLYPLIRCGGGSFAKFVLGTIGCLVGVGLAAGMATQTGAPGLVAVAAAGVFGLVALIYMARIVMTTAENRGLSKWLGLLTFVPLVNIFVYPYIAFHDGFRAPNKVGLLLGLLLAYGPLPAQIQMVDQVMASAQQYEALLGSAGSSSEFDATALQDAMGELGAAMERGNQLEGMQGMDGSGAEQMEGMQRELAKARDQLMNEMSAPGTEAPMQPLAAIPRAVPDSPVGDRTGHAPPASAAPAMTASIGRNGDRGFATPKAPACPPGTESRGSGPPSGRKLWCARVGKDAGMKHGWMSTWHDNQEPEMAGEYSDGMRIGVWTRWYPSGGKRVQAEFVDGLQDGALIAWDERGAKVHEGHFAAGVPVSR